jgi:hypothetical protein
VSFRRCVSCKLAVSSFIVCFSFKLFISFGLSFLFVFVGFELLSFCILCVEIKKIAAITEVGPPEGGRVLPGAVRVRFCSTLFCSHHWPTNESPPFASCFWPNFPINSRRRPELGHFV